MVTAKKAMTNGTKREFTSHCRIPAKTNFLLLFPARFAHARYSSRLIDRFLNWGDHGRSRSRSKAVASPSPFGAVRTCFDHVLSKFSGFSWERILFLKSACVNMVMQIQVQIGEESTFCVGSEGTFYGFWFTLRKQ